MSPTPLIELQRRLAEAGRIRMGEKTDKGAPKRLTNWRITSPTEELIRQAAGLYGGQPVPWDSPTGPQWEVTTTTAELPVLVMPGYSFRQGYEFRTSPTLVERRCDGVEMDDGKPCVCNAEGDDKCVLLTRLTVALPELTTMLGWRLETKGDNAAKELLGSMDLVQGVAGGRPFVPARLRIVERRGNVNGQAVRFVVPVIDVSVRYAEILGGGDGRERAALPAGYTPIAAGNGQGVSLAQGLEQAKSEGKVSSRTVPLPEADVEFGDEPIAVESADPVPVDAAGSAETLKPTKRQLDKLNVLVGTLREAGAIQTVHLWSALATSRNVDVDVMCDLLKGREDGEWHWAPLRNDMNRREASDLIDRLEKLEKNVGAAA